MYTDVPKANDFITGLLFLGPGKGEAKRPHETELKEGQTGKCPLVRGRW